MLVISLVYEEPVEKKKGATYNIDIYIFSIQDFMIEILSTKKKKKIFAVQKTSGNKYRSIFFSV